MSLAVKPIITQIARHAQRSGKFQRVNKHEPKSAPGNGIACSIFLDRILPARSSGLKSTTALVVVNVLLQMNMVTKPEDDIDVGLTDAVDFLMNAYSGKFTLEGLVRSIDLLGMTGASLSCQFGYREQDQKMYRVAMITLPLIVNDVWEQVP